MQATMSLVLIIMRKKDRYPCDHDFSAKLILDTDRAATRVPSGLPDFIMGSAL